GELLTALGAFAGRTDSSALREEVADFVLTHYQQAGWPVTDVAVSGDGGRLDVRIAEGRFGTVSVDGGHPWMREAVRRDWQGAAGRPLTMGDVARRLDWLHRNPLHAATIGFEPGAEPAVADAVVSLHSRRPVRLTAGWRNDGVPPLARHRFFAGFELADAFGLPFWLGAEAFAGEDFDDYRAGRAEWRGFLPGRQELRISGHWADVRADGIVPGFTSSSEVRSRGAAIAWRPGLPVWRGWHFDAGAGIGFLRTDSEVRL